MTGQMETYISRQLKFWILEQEKLRADEKVLSGKHAEVKPFITISREYGCGGYEIGEEITRIMNEEYKSEPVWAAYDKQILEKLSEDLGFSTELAETLTADARNNITRFFRDLFSDLPSTLQIYKKLAEIIRTLATNGNVIIIGRGGSILTQKMKGGIDVKVVAPLEWRIKKIAKQRNISPEESEEIIVGQDVKRRSVFNEVIKYDIMDPYKYHIVINNKRFTNENAARLIIETMKINGLLKLE